MPDVTSLEALPPFVGDAPVAAVLLRDLAVALTSAERHGQVAPAAVRLDSDGRFVLGAAGVKGSPTAGDRAALAAPELFDGAQPDDRTDVYAAACLVLTRYLGTSPVAAVSLARRASSRTHVAALRQAHRTLPARLGALPAPYRSLFAQAVAKERHLRPTPAQLAAQLDAALAGGGEAEARAHLRRLLVLAQAFVSVAPPAVPAPAAERAPAAGALHLPIRSLPSFGRPTGAARAALIAAVAVLATGGVALAAVVGIGAGGTPQADATTVVTPSASSSATGSAVPVVATTSAAKPTPAATSSAPPAAAVPTAGSGGGANGGSGGGTYCLSGQAAGFVALDPVGSPTGSAADDAPTIPSPEPSQPPTTPPASPKPPATTAPSKPPTKAPTHSTPPPVHTSPAGGGSGSGGSGSSGSGSGGSGSGGSGSRGSGSGGADNGSNSGGSSNTRGSGSSGC